ncbi:hypothetical protein E2C01_059329 [Portunus trituberculatus]|uniref:Uncharacterized protein n=1 Tax=Portunus trituberculatus TaxID=210409 RepID=A0A5B7H817_PORTR|nr:hypothetical protein [Portunus trituberculatus]
MASPDLTRQRVYPCTPAAVSTPMDSPPLSPGLQDAMDTDAASRASSPQPGASRRRVSFPEGHGKILAQLYEWFMALLKQHPSLEPLMKEGRRRPYLTVNPRSAAYDMLVKEGLLGLTMTPADPDARQQMVIVHGVSTINVNLLSTPEAFLWLRRRVVAGELRPQLLGLVEGAVPSSVHLHGLGRFHVGLLTCAATAVGSGIRTGSASRRRAVGTVLGGHPSSRCLEKIRAGTRVVPLCCNCGGDHNASSRRCPARPRPVREPQIPGTTIGPSRVVFRPAPAPQHNAWANGAPSWSDFPALPLPAAQPSAFPPLPGTAAPAQSGAAHPPVPATRPPVPVPPRTAPYYVAVVGAEDVAPASQAGVPAILQNVVQLLLGIQAEVRDLRVRVTALERQRDAASPPPLPVPAPVQSAQQPARKNQPQSMPVSPRPQPVSATVQPAPDNKPQSVPASPRPQPMSATVQPASDNKPQSAPASPQPQPVSVPPSLSLIASPRVCRLVLGPSESSHRPLVQPPLPPAPAQPVSVPDRTPPQSGSPSVEADLVLDDMDTDEEEWIPTAARTLDRLQAELAAVTEGLSWLHQQVSLSQVGGVGE